MTIDELINKSIEIVDKLTFDEELHDPKDLGLSDASAGLYSSLIKVDAIKTVQGTEKIYLGQSLSNKETIKADLEKLRVCLKAILEKINKTADNYLTRNDVVRIITDNKEDENDYYIIIGILSSLDITTSAGRGRTGGIKIYNKSEDDVRIQKAVDQISEQGDKELQSRAKEDKESVLYPSAAKEISGLGFQALIMGTLRRLPGEWNTPDVIGYRVNRFKNIGGAEIEIVTVEVKWDISKYAIAETNSHQRLGHKSYLMVHQAFEEVDRELLPDLISKGIGLICRNANEHKVYIPARKNNPDKFDIDEFLGLALETTEIENLKKDLSKAFYTDYLRPLFPN